MNTKDDKKKEMLYFAYKNLIFKEMLIEQSNGWLSAEEGNKNLIERIKNKKDNLI